MEELLTQLREINKLLQMKKWMTPSNMDLPFSELSEVIGRMLKLDVFIVSHSGKLLGWNDENNVGNVRIEEFVVNRQFPQYYIHHLLAIVDTVENIAVDSVLSIFPIEEKDMYKDSLTTIVPIFFSGKRLGWLIAGRTKDPFLANDLILVEHVATIIATELLHWRAAQKESEAREKKDVQLAFRSLSYSECSAIKVLFHQLDGLELKITASKIATEHHITRSVIVNAIRKLESAGIITSRSLGMKGTYIRIKSEFTLHVIQEELNYL